MTFEVHEAAPDDRLGVRRVLDAAMLRIRDDLPERIDAGDVLVARDAESEGDAPILGALVLVPRTGDARVPEEGAQVAEDDGGAHVDAVAVRRARRGQGVGSALVRAAVERRTPLTAEFDPDVRPFYESLGFEISRADADGNRLQGRYDGGDGLGATAREAE